jgi:hypothetical protein
MAFGGSVWRVYTESMEYVWVFCMYVRTSKLVYESEDSVFGCVAEGDCCKEIKEKEDGCEGKQVQLVSEGKCGQVTAYKVVMFAYYPNYPYSPFACSTYTAPPSS